MKVRYSKIRKSVGLDTAKLASDGYAYLTHYLQNNQNGVAQYFRKGAESFLNSLPLLEEPEFQYELPIKWDIPFAPPENPSFKFIDLFAGIGGIRLAYQKSGGKCVFTSEWNEPAKRTYEANFGEVPFGDITKIDASKIPDHDLLLAGFPCQPFSIAGVSKKNSLGKAHGFLDETQGTLFFDIARIIKKKTPKAFMLENVKNLKTHDGGKTFSVIQRTLNELGYKIFSAVLNSKHFVPQHRERIIIVGFRREVYGDDMTFEFPKMPEQKLTFKQILEPKVDPKYTLTDNLWKYLQGYADKHKAKGNGFGFGMTDLNGISRTLSARYYKDGSEILIPQKNKNPRRLTPRECARLQGFPDSFVIPVSDTQAYKQFGNSVTFPLIRLVAKQVIKALSETNGKNTHKRNRNSPAL